MGHSDGEARGGLRLTFGRTSTVEEARHAATVVRAVLERVRTAVPA
jgi:cysteine sulfinate desulfinase/cysteine desulfurase-like protein